MPHLYRLGEGHQLVVLLGKPALRLNGVQHPAVLNDPEAPDQSPQEVDGPPVVKGHEVGGLLGDIVLHLEDSQ